MDSVGSIFEDLLLPSPEDQRHLVGHLILHEGKGPDSLDKVVILTQLLHHGDLVMELVIVHEYCIQAKHPTNSRIQTRLVRMDIVTHLTEHLLLHADALACLRPN
jgi:hypothetical protein